MVAAAGARRRAAVAARSSSAVGVLDALLEGFDEGKIRRDFRGRFANKPGARQGSARSLLDVAGRAVQKRKLSSAELPTRVGGGAWSKHVRGTVRDLRAGTVADTEAAHRARKADGGLGPYTAERQALHERIADLLLRHAAEHPGKARAVFLAGGPASGKSTLITSGKVALPADAVDVNPDLVRTMLPEYAQLVAAGDAAAGAKTHEEASHVSKLVLNIAMERQHHVVIDSVGAGDPGKFVGKVAAAKAAGYAVEVHYVTIATEEAERRAAARAKRSGRAVPTGYLRAAHREVSARFVDGVSKMAGIRVTVYDNSGASVRLVAERSPGEKRVQVRDAKLYAEFVAKARAKNTPRRGEAA